MQHAYSSQLGILSPNLKRSRSGEFSRPPGEIPRLPDIGSDLVLEVYTHESLRPPNVTKAEDFTDNARLARLGKEVLDTAATLVFFKRKPFLSVDEIEDRKAKILDDDVIQGWVTSYQMVKRILCLPEYQSELQAPEECRRVFYAYVGAVFRHSGQEAVGKWVELLVQYHEQWNSSSSTTSEIPPAKKVKNEPTSSPLTSFRVGSPMSSTSTASTSTASTSTAATSAQLYSPTSPYLSTPTQTYPSVYPARQVPPHMSKPTYQAQPSSHLSSFSALLQSLTNSQSFSVPAAAVKQPQRARSTVEGKPSLGPGMAGSSAARPNPLAPATPNAPFLPMFNQSAQQRGVKVDYSAAFSGPSHAGQWTVQCIVNGIRKGEGKGSSKQIAKEEAARQAYYSMGWT